MATRPKRWIGYALLMAGLLLLYDTYTFLRTNWSPLRVPMYAANEIALGYLLAIAGVVLLVAPAFLNAVESVAPDSSAKLAAGIADHSIEFRRQQCLPLQKGFSTAPNRGLVGGTAMLLVLMPTFLMVTQREANQGIFVHLTPRTDRGPDENCLAGPIVVTVKRTGTSSRFFVDGVEVRRNELGHALRSKLAARANWEVFVEGDDAVNFADPVDALDVISSLHAKAVIVTPKLKEQLAKRCLEQPAR